MGLTKSKFGVYDFDLETGELFRSGVPVRLQPQPAQVLRILIAAAGQVVSRETIREALWGSEVHVDFDKALNYAVSQVRAALRDSADSPRYVETIPKIGYRFIAPLETDSAEQPVLTASTSTEPKRWFRRREFALGTAAISLGAAFGLWRLRGAGLEDPRIAVALFDNETGNSALDQYANDVTDSLVVMLAERTMGRYGIVGNAALLRQHRSFRDLDVIAQELQTQFVILGQVKADGNSGFVLAHLIQMPDEHHVKAVRLALGKPESDAAEISKAFLKALASS